MSGRASRTRLRAGGQIRAAGALLYTRRGDTLAVAVIHRPRHDDCTFPKGKLEPGEHVLAAAVREVTEETGIRPVLGQPLATVRYLVDARPKRVDYWAAHVAEPASGRFVPNDEVDQLDWLAVPEAATRLSYAHDVQLLDRLVAVATADTVPCVLLRHASAGHKGDWPGDDLLRPLDDRGMVDAQTLARLLACYAPVRVISSAAERCLGTVRPYAERIGAAIEAEPAFTVRPAAHGDRAEAARRRMAGLLAYPAPIVICAHRENMPVLLTQARAVLGKTAPDDTGLDDSVPDNSVPDDPVPDDPGPDDPVPDDPGPDDPVPDDPGPDGSAPDAAGKDLPKGGFWVLHVAGHRLAAVERHDLRETRSP
ncbi:MAG TPA: NUDIX domain-containing protein [Streptosporangiaceae bacterium]